MRSKMLTRISTSNDRVKKSQCKCCLVWQMKVTKLYRCERRKNNPISGDNSGIFNCICVECRIVVHLQCDSEQTDWKKGQSSNQTFHGNYHVWLIHSLELIITNLFLWIGRRPLAFYKFCSSSEWSDAQLQVLMRHTSSVDTFNSLVNKVCVHCFWASDITKAIDNGFSAVTCISEIFFIVVNDTDDWVSDTLFHSPLFCRGVNWMWVNAFHVQLNGFQINWYFNLFEKANALRNTGAARRVLNHVRHSCKIAENFMLYHYNNCKPRS